MFSLENDELAEIIQHTIQNPEWWFEVFLHFKILDWQLEGIHAVFDVRRKLEGLPTVVNHEGLPRISIRSCHGTGKTQWLALLLHIWNFTNFGKVACTAPKLDQLTRRLAPRYRRALRDAEPFYKQNCEVLGREIIYFGDKDWGAYFETGSEPENLAGYHDEPQLFLIDEASSKRLDQMYSVIEGALSTPGSVLAEIGNPTRTDGEFYNHHNDKNIKHLYHKMHIRPEDAPEIVSPAWLDAMAIKYGKDSPTYLIRCRGEFASYDEAILYPLEYIDDALSIEESVEGDGSHPKIRVTIDVADGGADSTVVTGAIHYATKIVVVKQKAYNFQPAVAPIESAKAGVAMFEALGGKKDGVDDFVVDANGVGAGTAGTLILEGYNVIKHYGRNGSDDPTRYRNMRVQVHFSLYEHFRDSKIVILEKGIDDLEELKRHLLGIKRTGERGKTDDIITKDQVKKDLGFSPDRTDSLSMQTAGIMPEFVDVPLHIETLPSQAANYDASLSDF